MQLIEVIVAVFEVVGGAERSRAENRKIVEAFPSFVCHGQEQIS